MVKRSVILFFLGAAGCVSGPKEDRTFAEKMNGDNYTGQNSVMSVPVLERKLILRKISGNVWCGEGLTKRPANHARVELKKKKELVASFSTGADGAYTLSAPLEQDAIYLLTAKSSCGNSKNELKAEAKDFTGINLYLEK